MNRVLVVGDVRWWCFERMIRGLKEYCRKWEVDSCYLRESTRIDHKGYPVVFYLCDWLIDPIFKNKIPRKKLILAIRQAGPIGHLIYNEPGELEKTAYLLAVSNPRIYSKYSSRHSNIRILPGGVDTHLFSFKERHLLGTPRVGWAGSIRSWGREFRGLNIIEEACSTLGFLFNPAIREDRRRTLDEMIRYYHDEIDIYVDMSKTAGRQNGLLEAGSCGCPIISSDAGTAHELIDNGVNGFISKRNVQSLIECLRHVELGYMAYSENIRRSIEYEWSWEVHAPMFEDVFEECLNG